MTIQARTPDTTSAKRAASMRQAAMVFLAEGPATASAAAVTTAPGGLYGAVQEYLDGMTA